jgi:hypothetical protein
MVAMYPKQVVFTTTDEQFDELSEAAVLLGSHGVSRAQIIREAIDRGLGGAIKALTPKIRSSGRTR